MSKSTYRYNFRRPTSMQDVEDSLNLALLAAEGLHGRSQVILDGDCCLDPERRTCLIDATSQVGHDIARIFTSIVRNEFGDDAFVLERL